MNKKNFLNLSSSSYVEFVFNIKLEKHELPIVEDYGKCIVNDSIKYFIDFKYDIKCFKLHEDLEKKNFRYKIVSNYYKKVSEVNLDIINIINEIRPYLSDSISLIINNNNVNTLVQSLTILDCFKNIIFRRKFTTMNYDFSLMKNVSNVICNKFPNLNFLNLPEGLNMLRIEVEFKSSKLFQIPLNTKKLLIVNKSVSRNYLLNMEDISGIKKILFVDNVCYVNNFNELDYDVLILGTNNRTINLNNLRVGIKVLWLYDTFNNNLDYLPDSVEKIIFNGLIHSNLSNLPSSTKIIEFKSFSCDKLDELPDSIEKIHLQKICNNFVPKFKHLPKKLKLFITNSTSSLNNKLKKYKKINKLDFKIITNKHKNTKEFIAEQINEINKFT